MRHSTHWMIIALLLVLTAAAWPTPAARAQDEPPSATGEEAKPAEPPPKHGLTKASDEDKKVYDTIRRRVMGATTVQVTSLKDKSGFGLAVGTQVAPLLEEMLWGYRYSGDTAWLDKFVEMMTALEGTLTKDPDGRPGWFSAPSKRVFGEPWPAQWPNAPAVTAWPHAEARVIAVCADFEMTVRDEMDVLQDKYLIPAKRWTRLAEEGLIPKWRDCYAEISQDRAIYSWPTRCFVPGKIWEPYPGTPNPKAGITLPHWAVSEIIRRDLKLWELGRGDEYRTRAAKLLRWQKSCLRFYRGGQPNERGLYGGKPDKSTYFWNYWDPAADEDFRSEGGLAFGMYMSLRPLDYARDVEAFVEAYHTGTVIDKDDIRRLVETQVRRMMSGDAENPTWRDPRGEKRGMLWPCLAEFDDRLDYLVKTTFGAGESEFGSKLRFMQERPWWDSWRQRKLGDAKLIDCNLTHEDFRAEMDKLIRSHPAPDPRKPPRGR